MKILLFLAIIAVSTFAQNSTIRFFHGIVGAPNVDIYVNSVSQGNLLANNVAPGSVSQYRSFNETNVQNVNFIVTQAGSTSSIVANQTVNLPANFRAATVLVVPSNQTGATTGNTTSGNVTSGNATSGASAISLVVVNDQLSDGQTPLQNASYIRLVNVLTNGTGANATTSATALNLQLSNGTSLASNVNFLGQSSYIQLPPGSYNLQVIPASGGQQPVTTQSVNLTPGQALTFFAFVPAVGSAPTLVQGVDTPAIFVPQPPTVTAATSGVPSTSGAVTSGAVTSGSVTSGAVTSGAPVTPGAVTSGVSTPTTGATGVIITGFTSGVQRPVSAAGTLRCDVATLGVVCAILFTVFYRRD